LGKDIFEPSRPGRAVYRTSPSFHWS
jgi:hypothetical protein